MLDARRCNRARLTFAAYRPDIDGLRAVSILAVALYHLGLPGMEAGYLGVDVFFVISGFLITGQLLREAETTGTILIWNFYARRVRRLLPAFVLMSVGASLLALLFLLPGDEQRLFGNALSRSAAFYYNIAVWRGSYDYAAADAQQQVLMHTWSLGVEEQFYLVWPWICLGGLRIGSPLGAFSAVVVASLLGAWWALPRDPAAVFFLLPFRAWELGLGACAAVLPRAVSLPMGRAATAVGAGLLGLALFSRESPGSSMWPALVAAAGASLVAAFGATRNLTSFLLCSRGMVTLGRLSYAWYLWHWSLLVVARLVTVVENPLIQVGALVASFLLSALTYFWIERPARGIQIRHPAPMVTMGIGAIAVLILLGRTIELRGEKWAEEPRNAARLARAKGASSRPCEQDFSGLGCGLSPNTGVGDGSLLLWGDSFARALSPALSEYSRESGTRVHLVVESSCPPLLGIVPGGRRASSRPDRACGEAIQSLARQIQQGRPTLSGVVLAARWPGYVAVDVSRGPLRMHEWGGREVEGSRAIEIGLSATLDLMDRLHLKVLVVGVPPSFPFEVPACLWRDPTRCFVDKEWNKGARELSRASIERAIAGRPQVRYVELFEKLCPGDRCSAGTPEEPLLADRTHLTAIAAQRRVLPILVRHLEWLRGANTTPSPSDRPE